MPHHFFLHRLGTDVRVVKRAHHRTPITIWIYPEYNEPLRQLVLHLIYRPLWLLESKYFLRKSSGSSEDESFPSLLQELPDKLIMSFITEANESINFKLDPTKGSINIWKPYQDSERDSRSPRLINILELFHWFRFIWIDLCQIYTCTCIFIPKSNTTSESTVIVRRLMHRMMW